MTMDILSGSASLEWGGERLTLLPERAVWWARGKTLFMADPHFGKASAFRHAGLAVPETSHSDDLHRLDWALSRTGAKRLVILGDFFHAKTGRSEATLLGLTAWRERQAALEIILVPGNHDRHAGTPPDIWRIECVTDPWILEPFACVHEPRELPGQFVLAGHVHPSFGLRDRIGSGVRGPCFHFGRRVAVLPAFGTFTGSHPVTPRRGDRIFLVGDDQVIDVSSAVS